MCKMSLILIWIVMVLLWNISLLLLHSSKKKNNEMSISDYDNMSRLGKNRKWVIMGWFMEILAVNAYEVGHWCRFYDYGVALMVLGVTKLLNYLGGVCLDEKITGNCLTKPKDRKGIRNLI